MVNFAFMGSKHCEKRLHAFCPFLKCFQKPSLSGALKPTNVWQSVKHNTKFVKNKKKKDALSLNI